MQIFLAISLWRERSSVLHFIFKKQFPFFIRTPTCTNLQLSLCNKNLLTECTMSICYAFCNSAGQQFLPEQNIIFTYFFTPTILCLYTIFLCPSPTQGLITHNAVSFLKKCRIIWLKDLSKHKW